MKDSKEKFQGWAGCCQISERLLCLSHTLWSNVQALLLCYCSSHTENELQSVLEVPAQLAGRGQVLPPCKSGPGSPLFGSGCIIFLSGTQQ